MQIGMEDIKANKLEYLPTYFRCRKCLTLQEILEISFPDYSSPFYHIYIIKKCQNKHYEKYKIKELDEINNNINLFKLNCSSCNLILSQYYCLLCYKTFCLHCKEKHAKTLHNTIIKLKDIDNICFNHPFQKNINKFKNLFACNLCCNYGYSEYEDEYLSEIKEFQDTINFSKNHFLTAYNQIECPDNQLLLLSKEYKKRIDKEYDYIQNYYNQINNLLNNKIKLNFIFYKNLQMININNFLFSNYSLNDLTYNEKKQLFTRGHLSYYSRYDYEAAKDLKNKLLKNNEDIFKYNENQFKMNPCELKFTETLEFINERYVCLDVNKNINNIPILIFSLKNKINIMNLNTRKNISGIIVDSGDREINFLKYYIFNKIEYILCKINETTIIIFDIQNNFKKIFNLESTNIRSCLLFNYKNKLYLFISFLDKVNIYDINNNNNQLITSIHKNSQIIIEKYTDNIFIDKNNILYIIICYQNKAITLKDPNYKIYKEYINIYPEEGMLILPKVYEFEKNITYLLTIFYDYILNIYDFYTGDIIKQFNLGYETRPCDYIFWNYNLLLIMTEHESGICLDLFTGEINYLLYSYIMKKIYLDDCEESLIHVKQNVNDIVLLSFKKSDYLINKEKEELQRVKEKYNLDKEKYNIDEEQYNIDKEEYNNFFDINLGNLFD